MLVNARSQHEKDYYDSLPNASKCGYGLLRISARRFAIVTPTGIATIAFGVKELPRYEFVEGCNNLTHDEAMTKLVELCKATELRVHQIGLKSNGKHYLELMGDREFLRVPLGPICEAGLQDYCTKRIIRIQAQEANALCQCGHRKSDHYNGVDHSGSSTECTLCPNDGQCEAFNPKA